MVIYCTVGKVIDLEVDGWFSGVWLHGPVL